MKPKIQFKWFVLISILLALLISGCNSEPEDQTYHVGLLSGVDTFNSVFDGFKAEMEALGYIEGENITYDFQAAGGDSDKMKQIAEQFVADNVDMIVTTTTDAAKAAQTATAGTDISVIFSIIQDPVGVGLVNSLPSPGANLTGVARPPTTYLGKRVELLTQMAPNVESLLIMYDPDYSTAASSVPAVKDGASALGVEVVEIHVKSTDDIAVELEKLAVQEELGVDAIQFMPDTVNSNSSQIIMDFGNEHGLPVVAHTKSQIKLGALFLYADDNIVTGKIAASLANKIFKGANPGELPVEVSDLFLTINMPAAKFIGLEISDTVLQTADEIMR